MRIKTVRKTLLRPTVAASIAVLTLGVSACSSSGNAGTQTESPSSEKTSSPSNTSTEVDLAAMDPCKMLTSEEKKTLGLQGPGETDRIMGARECGWDTKNGNLAVRIDKTRGLKDLDTSVGKVKKIKIDGRKAQIAREVVGPGDCGVTFAVGSSATISVDSVVSGDTAAACKLAKKVAPMVEAKLPES